jgi:hypothetical protein
MVITDSSWLRRPAGGQAGCGQSWCPPLPGSECSVPQAAVASPRRPGVLSYVCRLWARIIVIRASRLIGCAPVPPDHRQARNHRGNRRAPPPGATPAASRALGKRPAVWPGYYSAGRPHNLRSPFTSQNEITDPGGQVSLIAPRADGRSAQLTGDRGPTTPGSRPRLRRHSACLLTCPMVKSHSH